MRKPLIILGISARAAAMAARQAGFAPYSIDFFADEDTRQAGPTVKIDRFPQDFLSALRTAPDAPWMYAGGLENYPDLVQQLSAERVLLGNGPGSLRGARDPAMLARTLSAAGFRYPVTDGAVHTARVFKPLKSGGGRGVCIVPAEDSRLPGAAEYEQLYLEGKPASAFYVAAKGECRLIGASRQLIGREFGSPEIFGYAGSVAPLHGLAAIEGELNGIGAALTRAFGLQGVFGLDLLLRGDEVWVLEVNPRITASAEILDRVHGCNTVALHVCACAEGRLDLVEATPRSETNHAHGKAVVYARSICRAGKVLSELVAAWNDRNSPVIADIPQAGSAFKAGEPVATVFGEGVSEAEVLGQLRDRSKRVLAALERL